MTDEVNYLEDRVEKQRKWHSDKASLNKRRYHFVEMIVIVAGALIPVINVIDFGFVSEAGIRLISAVIGALIVISVGAGKLFKFQENWINYRILSETLKREREFYLFQVGNYDTRSEQKRQKILVQRVENILASTTDQFVAINLESQGQTTTSVEENSQE